MKPVGTSTTSWLCVSGRELTRSCGDTSQSYKAGGLGHWTGDTGFRRLSCKKFQITHVQADLWRTRTFLCDPQSPEWSRFFVWVAQQDHSEQWFRRVVWVREPSHAQWPPDSGALFSMNYRQDQGLMIHFGPDSSDGHTWSSHLTFIKMPILTSAPGSSYKYCYYSFISIALLIGWVCRAPRELCKSASWM